MSTFPRLRPLTVAALAATVIPLTGCGVDGPSVARCDDAPRMGLVAQSVPAASYLPCIAALSEGWSVSNFGVRTGRTRFQLVSDRAPSRPVDIELTAVR